MHLECSNAGSAHCELEHRAGSAVARRRRAPSVGERVRQRQAESVPALPVRREHRHGVAGHPGPSSSTEMTAPPPTPGLQAQLHDAATVLQRVVEQHVEDLPSAAVGAVPFRGASAHRADAAADRPPQAAVPAVVRVAHHGLQVGRSGLGGPARSGAGPRSSLEPVGLLQHFLERRLGVGSRLRELGFDARRAMPAASAAGVACAERALRGRRGLRVAPCC